MSVRMETKMTAEQAYREMTRAHVFIGAGALFVSAYILALASAVIDPGAFPVFNSIWIRIAGMGLGVPMHLYGIWCQMSLTMKVVIGTRHPSEQDATDNATFNASFKDITDRSRRGFLNYALAGGLLGLALYFLIYPRPGFHEWSFIFAAILGFQSGSLVHTIVSLKRCRPTKQTTPPR